MNVIQISVNGEIKATAPLWGLTTGLTISSGTLADGTHHGVDLRLGGMDETNYLRWLTMLDLPIGTSIQIDILESGIPDEPTRKQADPDPDSKREREDFEWAKAKYLELKHKFDVAE